MTISIIIFSLSLIAFFMLVMNKSREINTGSPMFKLGSESSDETLLNIWNIIVYTVTHATARSIRHSAYRSVVAVERFVLRQFDRLSSRFSMFGDMVTGRDIPKNRGSVSFFLKNIESHKGKTGSFKK